MVSRFVLRRWFSKSAGAVVDNPYTGAVYCQIPYLSNSQITPIIDQAIGTQKEWKETKLTQRIELATKFMDEMKKRTDEIATDITNMMGKPLSQAKKEIGGLIERSNAMIDQAPSALADDVIPGSPKGTFRKIGREPVGVVLCVAPWNYPLLTAVNCVVPAILAGNSVLLKHSSRTPLVADHFQKAFTAAGAPKGLVTALHASHDGIAYALQRPEIGYVHFTGSVSGGHQIYSLASKTFRDVGLELGGKDPAYVRADANLDHAVDNIVDGGMYNAGQSCCGIERVYVHQSLYKQFIDKAVPFLKSYVLGDPLRSETSMGPLAQQSGVDVCVQQVQEAKQKGARIVYGGAAVKDSAGKGRFFQPTLIVDCNHSMSIMVEENFGPILAIQSVANDEEAIRLMNDSPYGLTAALYTEDKQAALQIAEKISTGTVFLNRCDYLDPYLGWTGVKDTGKGVSLSRYGFHSLTKIKSYNFKTL